MSQELYCDCLFDPYYFNDSGIKRDIRFVKKYSQYQAQLLGEQRIKMIADTVDWYHYIIRNAFNFSYGTKIHGSIMPILAGVPAVVLPIDSRTQEMADFFNIPTMEYNTNKKYTKEDLYTAYSDMDYSKFNKNYKKHFRDYEKFLVSCGIVDQINENNCFWSKQPTMNFDNYSPNQQAFIEYAEKLKREAILLHIGVAASKVRDKLVTVRDICSAIKIDVR